jgi:glutathione synthase
MLKLGVIMDPIASIKINKDSTFAMLLEAQARKWDIFYMELGDLSIRDGRSWANMQRLKVTDNVAKWYSLSDGAEGELSSLDVILMRKDPPVDAQYFYVTHLLDLAQRDGAKVINNPQALRDANEKLFTAWFPQCVPPGLVSRSKESLLHFVNQTKDVILKPLDSMGGASIFRLTAGDPNTNVIIETLTHNQQRYIMAQQYVPEISDGDKRILLIDGEPIPYALARVPKKGETRGNLALGATGVGVELGERDRWICQQVAPKLREMGLTFVGLDVIGDYLTEINVTSPTCIRELDAIYGLNIAARLMDYIETQIS